MTETFFKGFWRVWQSQSLNIYEKAILSLLISYWNDYKEKGFKYLQISYREIMRNLGEKDHHLIQKYVKTLVAKGLVQILNDDITKEHRHPPKIVLNEEAIKEFFQGDFFKEKQEKGPLQLISSKRNPANSTDLRGQKDRKNTGAAGTPGPDPHAKKNIEYIERIRQLKEKKDKEYAS